MAGTRAEPRKRAAREHSAGGSRAREERPGAALTNEERLLICELAGVGMSVRQIAAEVGCAASTVTRAAKALGVVFDRASTAAATAARIADGRARRTALANRLIDLANSELDRLSRPCRVHAFVAGQGGGYRERILPEPPPAERLALIRGATALIAQHSRLTEQDGEEDLDGAKSMLGQLAVDLEKFREATDREAS
jgi:Helix-turn-helix domain